jgi:hypothetical protein
MSGHGEKLTRKQEQALAALLDCATVKEAAARAQVSYRTLKAWLDRPHFQTAYQAAKRQVLADAIDQLRQVAGQAVQALRRNLTSAPAAVQVRAAGAVLDQVVRLTSHLDLEQRLTALEQAHAERHA